MARDGQGHLLQQSRDVDERQGRRSRTARSRSASTDGRAVGVDHAEVTPIGRVAGQRHDARRPRRETRRSRYAVTASGTGRLRCALRSSSFVPSVCRLHLPLTPSAHPCFTGTRRQQPLADVCPSRWPPARGRDTITCPSNRQPAGTVTPSVTTQSVNSAPRPERDPTRPNGRPSRPATRHARRRAGRHRLGPRAPATCPGSRPPCRCRGTRPAT